MIPPIGCSSRMMNSQYIGWLVRTTWMHRMAANNRERARPPLRKDMRSLRKSPRYLTTSRGGSIIAPSRRPGVKLLRRRQPQHFCLVAFVLAGGEQGRGVGDGLQKG